MEKITSEKEFHKSLAFHTKQNQKAVALKYHEGSPAPIITAIGKEEIAKEILKIARMSDIIIVEDEELTDVLSFQEIGAAVPPETWEALSQIFSFVLNRNDK